LLGAKLFPVCLELLLGCFEFLAQLPQFLFQPGAVLVSFAGLLLGALTPPGLLCKRFGQRLRLLLEFRLSSLQRL
jgi:hypothetical protein